LSFCTANVFENEHRHHAQVNQSKSTTTRADFRNGMAKRAKLRQRAKFRGDRSNHRRFMAIARLCKMAVAAIMDF